MKAAHLFSLLFIVGSFVGQHTLGSCFTAWAVFWHVWCFRWWTQYIFYGLVLLKNDISVQVWRVREGNRCGF